MLFEVSLFRGGELVADVLYNSLIQRRLVQKIYIKKSFFLGGNEGTLGLIIEGSYT